MTQSWQRTVLIAMLVVYAGLVTLPGLPGPTGVSLDWSWRLGLHLASQQGLAHGSDIVWTYGPLGHVLSPDTRFACAVIDLIVIFSLHAIWVLTLARLAFITASWSESLWCVVLFGTAALMNPLLDWVIASLMVTALLVLADRQGWRYLEMALMALLAVLATMIKANLGAQAIALFAVVTGIALWRSRPSDAGLRNAAALSAGIVLTGVPALYWAATGQISSFFSYLRGSFEIVRGYSEAMSLVGDAEPVYFAVLTVMCIAVALPLLAEDRRTVALGLLPCLITVFLSFKYSMVRQDIHVAGFEMTAATAAMFVFVCARSHRDRRIVALLQGVCLMLGYFVLSAQVPHHLSTVAERLRLGHVRGTAAALLDWPEFMARVNARSDALFDKARLPAEFDRKVAGSTVEAYPTNVGEVFANGWTWRPRPVFQTYSAYTPALDLLNAEHLRGDRAADFILLRWETIDGRHPFLEDPLSWRAMIDRYDVSIDQRPTVLLLERRATARRSSLVPLTTETVRWGQRAVPPEAATVLVMKAQTARSILGNVRNLFYRNLPTYLEVQYRSGRSQRWRMIRPNLSAGAIVQPLPSSLEELTAFLDDPYSAEDAATPVDPVEWLRFGAASPAEFRPEIAIQWSRLVYRDEPQAE